jgi:ribosomal protein S12 methylthiotransferase
MRYYLLSLGCCKNTVDSEGMSRLLQRAGHVPVEAAPAAEVLIVNTCGFIDIAKEESLGALRKLAKAKRRGQFLIAAGCLSQRYGHELTQRIPNLDGVLGTRRWMEITALVERLATDGHRPIIMVGDPLVPPGSPSQSGVEREGTPRFAIQGVSAYVQIAEGCSAPCSFCAIPMIKGPARSRPVEAIVEETRQLTTLGVKEIVLIAQDTTAYGHDWGERDALSSLIEAILRATPELPWLRLMYAYPQHITPRLVETMARHPQVCHYLDLPLQHSHPEILRRMNRPHDVDKVRHLIAALRQAMPDIALRTAFIVGYPGETEEEFEALLDFVKEIAFDRVGVFTYSREEGTPAANLPDQVPSQIKQERYRRLMELQQGISLARNRQMIGRKLDVLIEGTGDGLSVGRTYRDAPEVDGLVLVKEELPVGEMVPVFITEAMEYDLIGIRALEP